MQAAKRMARYCCRGGGRKHDFSLLLCSNPRTMLESSSRVGASNAVPLVN